MALTLTALFPMAIFLITAVLLGCALRRRYPTLVTSSASGLSLAYLGITAGLTLFPVALSLFSALTPMAYRVAGILALLASAVFWQRSPNPVGPFLKRGPWMNMALTIVTVVLLLGAAWILLCPVSMWDALSYHLPMAATYLQQQHLGAFATQNPRMLASPHAGELQSVAFMAGAGNDLGVEFPGLLALGAALAVVCAGVSPRGRLLPGRQWLAAVAVLFVLTAPQVLSVAVSGKSDLTAGALIAMAVWCIWMASRRAPSRARQNFYAVAGGAAAALAVASKVLGLNAVLGLMAMVGVYSWRGRWDRQRTGYALLGAALPLLLVVLPHSVRSFQRYGTILGWPPARASELASAEASRLEYIWHNLRLLGEVWPRPITYFNQVLPNENSHLGLAMLLGLPLACVAAGWSIVRQVRLGRKIRHARGLDWLLFVAVYMACILAGRRNEDFTLARFFIPLVPVTALWLFGALPWPRLFAQATVLRTGLPVLGALLALAAGYWTYLGPDEFGTPVLLGHLDMALQAGHPVSTGESRGESGYGAGYAQLDRLAKPGDRVLYVGGDDSLMYPCFGQQLDRTVWGVWDAEDMKKRMDERPEWIVVERAASPELLQAALLGALNMGYEYEFRSKIRVIFRRK